MFMQQSRESLHDHVFGTYITLRRGMAIMAAAFPLLLWIVGWLAHGIDLQSSMSAYYFAAPTPDSDAFPMRTWFVGLLFAIGGFLYLYKGFTDTENVALNLAGVFALMVAVFPMDRDGAAGAARPLASQLSIHGTAAVLLFVCLAFVAIWCADKTLRLLPPKHKGKEPGFRRAYRVIGLAMVAAPVAAFIITLVSGDRTRYIFWVEAFGIWAFSAYWFVKSREMSLSRAEEVVLAGGSPPIDNAMAA
ncbi:MAG TPA: hypothetical protein VK399_12985 [Longimicrobiaceae bacterium]|nr:hypothetical protein [Longimicrobiaceae bacterium]